MFAVKSCKVKGKLKKNKIIQLYCAKWEKADFCKKLLYWCLEGV